MSFSGRGLLLHKNDSINIREKGLIDTDFARFRFPIVMLAFVFLSACYIPVFAQDPGQPDSMIIGNLDGSVIMTDIARQISIPVWVKTDDSVTFVHIPLSSENAYFTSRNGGEFYQPLSLWDQIEFLEPNNNRPTQGWTNQSILGYAYISNPRDPQNFLNTNYEWVHVADFHLQITNDPNVYGDTTCLIEGFNPYYGYLLWALSDGVTQFEPNTVYSCVSFVNNVPPVIEEPPDGAVYNINEEIPFVLDVIATDGDGDYMQLTATVPPGINFQFTDIQVYPGYIHKRFRWVPSRDNGGTLEVLFTANDGNGGITQHSITLNVAAAMLSLAEMQVILGSNVALPLSLDNSGINTYVGGFEILLRYEEPIVSLTSVTRSERIADWDYFNVIYGDSSTVRIVGLADLTGHGGFLTPGTGPIMNLNFHVRNDDQYYDQFAHVEFITEDGNDNTISDTTGYWLIHPTLDDGWMYIINPDDILLGDVNLNTIPWEISDGVLLANHLVDPDNFPLTPQQLLAADANQDQYLGTVADLIYILNVVLGNISPPKVYYGADVSASISLEKLPSGEGIYGFEYHSAIPAGGVLIRLDHGDAEIGEIISDTDLRFQSVDRDGVLSVLIYDLEGRYIQPETRLFTLNVNSGNFDPSFREIQVSDRYGNDIPAQGRSELDLPMAYQLHGAYPNPFNSSTAIRFAIPSVSDVELTVYNVMGQVVRTINVDDMLPGERSIVWDGRNSVGDEVASGVYLYRVSAGGLSATSRMTLLK